MVNFAHPVSAAACVAEWHAAYNEVVERVIRKRLRNFPSHVPDCIQTFWKKFQEHEWCERFDPSKCSQAGYVAFFANVIALDYIRNRIHEFIIVPIEDVKLTQPEPFRYPTDGASWYLLQLVSTNRLEAAAALVFLCKVWMGIGPVRLVEEHWNSTLFQLCHHVATHLEGTGEELEAPRQVLRILREQLTLPAGHPLGERKLRELLPDEHSSGKEDNAGEDSTSKDATKKALFDYLEQARRVYLRGGFPFQESPQEFIQKAIVTLAAKLKDRFAFLIRTVRTMAHAEKLLAWGWEKLLNMQVERYGTLSCARGSAWLVKRMAFLLPRFPIPDDLAQSLSGCQPEETILNRLLQFGTDSIRAVRAVEASYYRASMSQG